MVFHAAKDASETNAQSKPAATMVFHDANDKSGTQQHIAGVELAD